MFAHCPRAGVRLDDEGVTLVEPPVTGIDRGTKVMQVAVDFRGRVDGCWWTCGGWVILRMKTESVRVKADGED
jgi:hypothetical protein